ncbi:hypothetical protein T4B_8928 [Trichinella pseudospiralis]|uniref:Uncharacterized protein n=1 Tax=Trichinella pseudospiralis TaxID=6337 RepID=A0A0V1ISI4_TRIPS|nr:hypothetical protein T4B_8928 [Trichinella pseudospiralis]
MVNEVLMNMYADDESSALKTVAEFIKLLKIGSFELSKWSSSCADVLSFTPQTGVTLINQKDGYHRFVMRVKILLQRLWQQGVDWDETLFLPEESASLW